MDPIAIFALIERAITIISTLISAGQAAEPAIAGIIANIRNLLSGAQAGTLTQAEMDATDALLDKQIADFNLDMPPAA